MTPSFLSNLGAAFSPGPSRPTPKVCVGSVHHVHDRRGYKSTKPRSGGGNLAQGEAEGGTLGTQPAGGSPERAAGIPSSLFSWRSYERPGSNDDTLRSILAGIVALIALAAPVRLSAQQPSPELLQSTYEEAEQAFREKRMEAAAAGYKKLAELSPKTAEAHAKLGLIYYLQGRFRDAVPAFRTALGLKPGLPNVATLLAISLAELGQYSEALPGLEKGFDDPADKDLRRLIGLELQRTYLALNRNRDAGRITARLASLYPDDPEILYHAGRFHADMAATAMRRLVDIAPDSVWGRQAAAEALDSQGSYALAIVEYRKVLAEQPGRPGVHYSVARAIQSSAGAAGSEDDALAEFQKELRVDPSSALSAYEAGEILRKRSWFGEARKFFEQAVAHRPDFGLGRIALGRVLRELEEPQQARVHLEAAVRLDPENEVARYQLALVYRQTGDLAGAQREMREFQRLRTSQPKEKGRGRLGLESQQATPQRLDAPETAR